MDNITHSLIGITISQIIPEKNPKAKTALLWSSVLASNFPDFDFLIGPLMQGSRIDYLLQHRGFSHTVIASFPEALISALFGIAISRLNWTWRGFSKIFGVSVLAVLLHLFADFWNDYGIHPFFPFNNHWYFGGFVFILEPALWLAMLPLAVWICRSTVTRFLWSAIGAGILIVCWSSHEIAWPMALTLTFLAMIVSRFQFRSQSAWPTVIAVVSILVCLFTTSRIARSRFYGDHQKILPEEKIVDLVLTPAPANPFCFRAVSVGLVGQEYVARTGVVSLLPGLVKPETCYPRRGLSQAQAQAPTHASYWQSDSRYFWSGEYRAAIDSKSELRTVLEKDCLFQGLLRFARVPFWRKLYNGSYSIGDLRYETAEAKSFSKFITDLKSPQRCPKALPPWDKPWKLADTFQ